MRKTELNFVSKPAFYVINFQMTASADFMQQINQKSVYQTKKKLFRHDQNESIFYRTTKSYSQYNNLIINICNTSQMLYHGLDPYTGLLKLFEENHDYAK